MENDRVVLRARWPISAGELSRITSCAERAYGKGLIVELDHADANEWLIIARPAIPGPRLERRA